LRVGDLNLRRFGPYDRAPRAQLSIRRDRRNYDPSIAGLGTDKAQRYFASDLIGFRLCDATEIAVVEVVAGSAQHRGTARAQPVRQCSTGSRKDPTKAKYVKKPGLLQSVEKKGKYASSMAQIICRPQNRLDRLELPKVIENRMLDRRFSIAPMMDWNESSSFSMC
jgi:hypothetical protein